MVSPAAPADAGADAAAGRLAAGGGAEVATGPTAAGPEQPLGITAPAKFDQSPAMFPTQVKRKVAGNWTPLESDRLLRLVGQSGTGNWEEKAQEFSGRTARALRDHWRRICPVAGGATPKVSSGVNAQPSGAVQELEPREPAADLQPVNKKRGQSLPCTPPVAKKSRPEVLADDHVRPPGGGRVRKKKKCDNEVVGGPARAPSRKSSRNAAPPRKLVPEGAGSKSVEAPVARSFTSAREPEAQAADP